MGKTKVGGLSITKKDILEAARVKALSYVVSPRKKKKITPQQKRTIAISEAARGIGGCQTSGLLNLLDIVTGLPVSKVGPETETGTFEPSTTWCENHRGVILTRHDGEKISLCLGKRTLARKGLNNYFLDDYATKYKFASTGEIKIFFDSFPDRHIANLVEALIE